MQPLNILICEDESVTALDFKERLERLGHRVVGMASNEEQALTLAHDVHPDLAVMDVVLAQGTRGTRVAKILDTTLDIPSIFVTGYEDSQTMSEAHEAHPLAYLVKPIRDVDLSKAIEFGMERHRIDLNLRRELAAFKKASHIARQLPKVSSDELLSRVIREIESLSGAVGPIAHHINNSLAVITGYLSMASSSTSLEAYERRFIDSALAECQKQKLFIQRLLWATEQGSREYRPITVESFVIRAVEDIRKVLRAGIEIAVGGIPTDLRVYADEQACTHAVEGLLINAVHAMTGSGQVRISVLTKFVDSDQVGNVQASPDTYAVVEVTDTGAGLSPESLEEICTFLSTNEREPSTEGLGLSVAYGVARAHHGWLEVDSTLGKGTTVRMYIPVLHTH